MSKLWIENNQSIPNVQYTDDDLSSTHTDHSSSIEKWNEHGGEVLQWTHVRRKIKNLVVGIVTPLYTNWAGLTSAEKEIAARWICAPYSLRLTEYSDDLDKENWMKLVRHNQGWTFPESVEGRAYIVEKMREHTSNELRIEAWSYDDSNDFLNTVIDYMMTYIFGEDQRLIQWITNEVGSPFELDGFAQKSYYDADLKDELVDIYNAYY